MARSKFSIFKKGDVIRTNPEKGYYGIAVVLDDGTRLEIEPGRWSFPMCHIAITPLLFNHEVTLEELDATQLRPMKFMRCFAFKGKPGFYREELLVNIYTTRNKKPLPIIGTIDPTLVYQEELSWDPSEYKFHWCGDIDAAYFGREAFIEWERKKEGENVLIK